MDLVKLLHSSVHQICNVYREGCGGFLVSFEKDKKNLPKKNPEVIGSSRFRPNRHCDRTDGYSHCERRNAFRHET